MADPESSVQSVISNDDLLTEILVRLPALSLVLFKSVSKRWNSLIKDAKLNFRLNLDPVSGFFMDKYIPSKEQDCFEGSESYCFVPLDIRIPICRSSLLATKFTFGPEVHGHVDILHSCNGLLLCLTSSLKLYVYNPSITNMFKLIPEPDNVTYSSTYIYGSFGLAFDPNKSPHYKIIYAEYVDSDRPLHKLVQIHTFSSKTGNWCLCGPLFSERDFAYFGNGIYWNEAIYWINGYGDHITKLDIINEHPVLTTSRVPLTLDLDGRVLYYQSTTQCILFESRGCLLLVGKRDACSRHFIIYEKRSVDYGWSMKYIVNLDDIIKPFPKKLHMWRIVFSIVLEEKEEDSFLLMELNNKVVQYKITSKTVNTISELGPNYILGHCFPFIPSFANP